MSLGLTKNRRVEPPFPEETLRELRVRAKAQIRGRMRAQRGSFPARVLAQKSEAIVERLLALPDLRQSAGVALYYPLVDRGEVDLRRLDQELRALRVPIYYPFQEPLAPGHSRTGFRRADSLEEVVPRGQRFPEPPSERPVALRGDISWVIVPALAVAADGHRIGYGAGYYDCTLGDVCPPALAAVVAYDFQLLSEVPAEAHDRALDYVVTEARSLDCKDPEGSLPG